MRKIMLAMSLFILLILGNNAYADSFQFSVDTVYAAFAQVTVLSNGKAVFTGLTDKLGRITISIANGTYTCNINYGNTQKSVQIDIDGTNALKPVELK